MSTAYREFRWSDGPFESAVLTWDGRIDNASDLRWRLGSSLPDGGGDAAIALAAYRRWGITGLADVIGDWSMVSYDSTRSAVILASDFMGVRPLYYQVLPGGVRWSTRLDALVPSTDLDALDERFIAGFLLCGRSPNRTPYEGVRSVPPGHAVCVTAAGATTQSFWRLPTDTVIRYADERSYDDQLRALFREAVAVRLQSEQSVVAELSGGLDSSSVVCMASHLIRTGAVATPRLTTVSYVHRASHDVPYIRAVEAHCGSAGVHLSTHDHPLASDDDVGDSLPEGWGPLHRAVATTVQRLGANLLLTGQGGDLVMGNYIDDSLQVAAHMRRGHLVASCRDALAWSRVLRVPAGWILWRALQATIGRIASRNVFAAEGVSAPSSGDTSLRRGFTERVGVTDPSELLSTDWLDAPPERRKHFLALTMMRELRLLQRHEWAVGFDSSHPFAHRPLIEFLMRVPADVLCRAGEPRRLMRRALSDLWPSAVRTRRSKSLFGAPWMEALRPLALGLLETRRWQVVERGWIDPVGFTARLEKLVHGLECNEPQLRLIILLEYWLRNRDPHRQTAFLSRTA
jgi:asparagine synthase (glutamine-hydrolysing)